MAHWKSVWQICVVSNDCTQFLKIMMFCLIAHAPWANKRPQAKMLAQNIKKQLVLQKSYSVESDPFYI